jgi:hypothetical protein
MFGMLKDGDFTPAFGVAMSPGIVPVNVFDILTVG